MTYLALCDSSYPTVLAFSFLNELMREFITKYETVRVNMARRPYSFIEFGKCSHCSWHYPLSTYYNNSFVQTVVMTIDKQKTKSLPNCLGI